MNFPYVIDPNSGESAILCAYANDYCTQFRNCASNGCNAIKNSHTLICVDNHGHYCASHDNHWDNGGCENCPNLIPTRV